MSGVNGEPQTRKGRWRSGSLTRRMITPRETRMKAKSVPMLVRSTTSAMLATAAKLPTKSPVMIVPT